MKISSKIKRKMAILSIAIGIAILIYPFILRQITNIQIDNSIDDFIDSIEESHIETEVILNNDIVNDELYENDFGNIQISDDTKNITKKNKYNKNLDKLYEDMKEYNRNLNKYGQQIVDAFSYENPSFNLKKYGYKENIIGIIEIPKIKVKLPIYLGATEKNLYKGATHLSQTSLPLGEYNSNVVIAAHRGLVRNQMFRNIDKLVLKDEVKITTFWETLIYRVSEIKVISPTDSSQVLIQDGKDLVTLITCHPYRVNNQRYVVYCERKK